MDDIINQILERTHAHEFQLNQLVNAVNGVDIKGMDAYCKFISNTFEKNPPITEK